MTNTDSSITTRYLASLIAHADAHGLGATIIVVKPPHSESEVGELHAWPAWTGVPHAPRLPPLLAWADSLAAPSVRITTEAAYSDIHLLLTGVLDDGTPTSVAVVPVRSEADLLRANTTVDLGAPVELELLRSLVSARAAEERTTEALERVS